MSNKIYGGQVGLLLLVVMGVIVALVMSIASRSLSDTVVSRQEKESSAAFSVAETGVEKAMSALQENGGQAVTGDLSGLSSTVTGNFAVTPTTSYGLFVREGEVAHLDLSTYVPTLTITWTRKVDKAENPSTCAEGTGLSPAAIEISAINGSNVSRSYYNPAGCNPGSNGFLNTAVDGGSEYRSMILSYSVPAGTTILRIKPIYAGATIAVSGSGLKDQLYLIQAKASGGDAQKEIEVRRGLDAAPSIFDFAVFSATTIVK
jgi:Tfp pilus assembly protein PilX